MTSGNKQASCSASPRGGLCRALKGIRSNVSIRPLSFGDLVAASPAVGLLASPHAPATVPHRRMPHHASSSRRLVSSPASQRMDTEGIGCSNIEMAMETSMLCDMPLAETLVCCKGSRTPSSCSLGDLPTSPSPYQNLSPRQLNDMDSSPRQSNGMHSSPPSGLSSKVLQQTSSRCRTPLGACGHPSVSSPSCQLPCARVLYSSDGPWCSAKLWKHKSHLASATVAMLVTLLFGLISSMKRLYVSVLGGEDIREGNICPNVVSANACNRQAAQFVDNCGSHRTECQETSVVSGLENLEASRGTGWQSKRLKSKLRSSFRSLSLQIPRKALTPLQLNTSSPSSSSPSSASSSSPCFGHSPKTKKAWTPKSPGFGSRLVKSFNHRVSHCSPTSNAYVSPPPQCEVKQQVTKRSMRTTYTKPTTIATLVCFPIVLCGLFSGKFVAGGLLTTWLLIVSIASTHW